MMRIIIDVDEQFSKDAVGSYLKSINIHDKFIRKISFEKGD